MIARVLTKRDEPRLALAVTAASAFGLAAVVVDDLVGASMFEPPAPYIYLAVACLILLAGIGPWLSWPLRGRSMAVTCAPGAVRAGDLTIEAGDVTALHIARAKRGHSVAIARGSRLVFLEVERIGEAEEIAAALNVPVTPFGTLGLRRPARWAARVQQVLAVAALAFGPLYLLATRGLDPMPGGWGKALFGIGGVATSWLSLAVLAARRLAATRAVAIATGPWDAHVALHLAESARTDLDAVRSIDERREQATEQAQQAARDEPTRVANLGRGEDRVAAWLARLDAIPSEGHAYRGDALRKDVLWETLGDAGAPVDARMAAARVLRRRYHEEEQALVRVVDDGDVRLRVAAALEEQHEEAEERLERLGPLFRAR